MKNIKSRKSAHKALRDRFGQGLDREGWRDRNAMQMLGDGIHHPQAGKLLERIP